jgi:hypothetical protein
MSSGSTIAMCRSTNGGPSRGRATARTFRQEPIRRHPNRRQLFHNTTYWVASGPPKILRKKDAVLHPSRSIFPARWQSNVSRRGRPESTGHWDRADRSCGEPTPYQRGSACRVLERAPWSGAKGNIRILDVREQAAVLCLVYGRRNNSKILAKDTAEMRRARKAP